MSPVEIAYFKHFMYDKQLEKNFMYYYRKNRVVGSPKGDKDGNPESVEQYLLQTSVKDVILKAFTFYPSGNATREISTFDYWKSIDDQWQQYMRSMADNFTNESWPLLRKTFAILRQNWDVPAYWRKENLESTEEVYERMHIDLPLPVNCWEHGCQQIKRSDAELIKCGIEDAKDGDIIVRIHKCKDHVSRLIILFRELVPYEVDGIQIKKALVYAYYNCYAAKLKIGGETHSILFNPEAKDVAFRLAFDEERKILMDKLAEVGLKWDEESKALISNEEAATVPSVSPEDSPECPAVPPQEEEESHDPEINFVQFDKVRRSFNSLVKGTMSINTRNHNWRIIINRTDSKEIMKKKVQYAMVGNTRSGETMLMLCNNTNGIPCNYTADNYFTINSREFCRHLQRLLSVYDDLVYANIEKVSEKLDSITYKVTKQ